MPTPATRLRGVGRVHKVDRHACPSGFVRNKHAQLIEGPAMPLIAIFSTNRNPFSDACEVFKSDCLASTSSLVDQGFGYAVVDIFLEAMLTPREFLETAFG